MKKKFAKRERKFRKTTKKGEKNYRENGNSLLERSQRTIIFNNIWKNIFKRRIIPGKENKWNKKMYSKTNEVIVNNKLYYHFRGILEKANEKLKTLIAKENNFWLYSLFSILPNQFYFFLYKFILFPFLFILIKY